MVPPADADEFAFLFTVAMETAQFDDKESFGALYQQAKAKGFDLRVAAFIRLTSHCQKELAGRQMLAVRLAASFPLKEGGAFDESAFLKALPS